LNDQGFPRQVRITKTDEFSSVFSFRKRLTGQFIVIHYLHNTHQHARLGLVVAKKVAKRSVDRNYMRRVLRTLFRLNQHELGRYDLVIRVQKHFSHADYSALSHEFAELMYRLKKPANQRTTPI
jgi:ribonuclease P protein component